MQWTHFQSWQMGKESCIVVTNFLYFLREILRRHANISASYLFHPAQNGKVFQHRPIHFIHSNAMNPFPKLTNGEKVMKYRYKLFIDFSKNCSSPCQLFTSASDLFHPAVNGKIFQHRPIDCIHINAMNPFSKLTNGEKVMKNRYKLSILFARNRASPCKLFSVIFIPSG